MYQLVLATAIVLSAFSHSCIDAKSQARDIESISPNGVYRVRISFTRGDDQLEKGRFQFLKGQEVINAYELQQADQYEPSVSSLVPVIEWVNTNVLRMGTQRPTETFTDQLIVSNATNEYFKYTSISWDRYESFDIFDLAPGNQVLIRATPKFAPRGTHNNSFGYGGMTQSGKKFGDVVFTRERESPSDGPVEVRIKITGKDLH